MEIHAPEKPIHSIKDFLIHLLTITIGILIALSFEGINEWRHHRHLVSEAKANITSEIRDNKQQIDDLLKRIPQTREDRKHIIQIMDDLLAHKAVKQRDLLLSYSFAEISATSWNTAETMGALGFMEYPEVKKYSSVYELQQQFTRMQQQTVDATISAINGAGFRDPKELDPSELRYAKQLLLNSLGSLTAEEQVAKSLSQAYGEALSKP